MARTRYIYGFGYDGNQITVYRGTVGVGVKDPTYNYPATPRNLRRLFLMMNGHRQVIEEEMFAGVWFVDLE